MKHIDFQVETDGFYGAYWPCQTDSDCALITMLGDDLTSDMLGGKNAGMHTCWYNLNNLPTAPWSTKSTACRTCSPCSSSRKGIGLCTAVAVF